MVLVGFSCFLHGSRLSFHSLSWFYGKKVEKNGKKLNKFEKVEIIGQKLTKKLKKIAKIEEEKIEKN